jgi:hypothetical protein
MVAFTTCGKVTLAVGAISVVIGIITFVSSGQTLEDAGTMTFECENTKSCSIDIPANDKLATADDDAYVGGSDIYSILIPGVPADSACEEAADDISIIGPDGNETYCLSSCDSSTTVHKSPEGADVQYELQDLCLFFPEPEGGIYAISHPTQEFYVIAAGDQIGEALGEAVSGLFGLLVAVCCIVGGLICCCAPFCCCKVAA